MTVRSRILVTLGFLGVIAILLASDGFAREHFATGPGDWGGAQGRPDDWGSPQPGFDLLTYLYAVLRIISLFNLGGVI